VKTSLTKQKNKAKKVNKKRDITQTLSYIQYEVAGGLVALFQQRKFHVLCFL